MPDTASGGGRRLLVAAGGTGGHLFPAEAMTRALLHRGWEVHLVTDHRATHYGGDFPAATTTIVSSATMSRHPLRLMAALWRLAVGFLQSWMLIGRLKPAAVVGFGGYPTLPPLLAAALRGIHTLVHDQNAVLGRANRLLAGRVDAVATSVARVRGAEPYADKVVETGNPVRPAVLEAAATPYPARAADDPFRLLVFGGSQGASVFSDLVPEAIARLPEADRGHMVVTQQAREDDVAGVEARYRDLGVAADVRPFFPDLPARIAESHLVISRSGASTCAELAVIGRPAILIPLPGALDLDQTANARLIDEAGGGWMVDQGTFDAGELAGRLAAFIVAPAILELAAEQAKGLGRPDAAERLADAVEATARGTQTGETAA